MIRSAAVYISDLMNFLNLHCGPFTLLYTFLRFGKWRNVDEYDDNDLLLYADILIS